jgi:hypothetical protein
VSLRGRLKKLEAVKGTVARRLAMYLESTKHLPEQCASMDEWTELAKATMAEQREVDR